MIKESTAICHFEYNQKKITFYNQRSKEWTYPYNYTTAPEENLHSAGCGLFSLSHVIEWMHGVTIDPQYLSDFARSHGAREDDGTNRPVLLSACMEYGLAKKYGFYYNHDGLLNGEKALWEHICNHKGVALCNLRKGHIVGLVDSIIMPTGERAFLAIDSYSESASEKIRDSVLQIIENSLIIEYIKNNKNQHVGSTMQYGLFWVKASLPMDYNLIYKDNFGGI